MRTQQAVVNAVLTASVSSLTRIYATRQPGRTFQLYQHRGLVTWGDLSYCPDGNTRCWIPDHVIQVLLTFPAGTPGDCPPQLHLPCRPGQFSLLKGTATTRGGIDNILTPPTTTSSHYTVCRWTGGEGRQWRPTPNIRQCASRTGPPDCLIPTDLYSRSYKRIIVHLQ